MQSAHRRAGFGLGMGLLLGLAAPLAFAAPPGLTDAPATPPATQPAAQKKLTPQEAQALLDRLMQQVGPDMQAEKFKEALGELDQISQLSPGHAVIDYNRACCLNRLDRSADALAALSKAVDEGFADADHMAIDADLTSLHDDPQFKDLVAKSKKVGSDYTRFANEAGAPIAGVKTVEANPADGLRYRIRMSPSATKEHPNRLLIWLHPSGGSMNSAVEKLAGKLVAHHVALMVFTQKDWNGWSQEDVNRLEKSIKEARGIPGIDPDAAPLVLGFSAGGQVALIMYEQNPKLFGGLAVDATYPIDAGKNPPQLFSTPPSDPAIKKEPILVVVGAADPNAGLWDRVSDGWKKGGAPLKIVMVPNRHHEWLFDNAHRQQLLLNWIDQALTGQVGADESGPSTQPATQAADADAPATQQAQAPLTPQERMAKVQETYKLLVQQMQNKDWAAALPTALELDKLAPKNGAIVYNKACILARLGKKKDALDALDESIDDGYAEADHMKVDEDLQSLRDDPQFKTLVEKAAKEGANYARFPYEQGADIPEVKTVEDNPAGGLRYRLRMSKTATAEHPDRLVVWFHPSGGSMDNTVESFAVQLAKRHLALVVFTQKGYMNWDPKDLGPMSHSIDLIQKIPGIDSKKAIGVGFSAGGQMMLQIYDSDPTQFSGMVLDAAYPLQANAAGQLTVQANPPNNPDIKKTPILVFVGGDDGGSKVWKMVENNWTTAGVPLTLEVVPHRKHEWMIDNEERQKMFIDWLADVAAGKLPGAPATEPATLPAAP